MQKYLFVLIPIIFILGCAYVYSYFNGTPWAKKAMQKSSQEYLMKKYKSIFEVNDVSYNFKKAVYFASAYSKSDNLYFTIEQINVSPYFKDEYMIAKWENEVDSQLQPFVKNVYVDNNFAHFDISYLDVQQMPLYEEFKSNAINIPTYNEIKEKILNDSSIVISLERDFDEQKLDEEYEKMFKIITFIKEKKYAPSYIDFSFCKDINNLKNYVEYKIPYEELNNIISKENIKKFKE